MEKFDLHLFEENYKNGLCAIETGADTVCMFEADDCYVIQTEQADPSMICGFKRYYADTLGLMEEGQFLKWGDTDIGVWKKYNKTSDVIEEKDYDQGWNITWEKLVPIIQEQGIKMGGIVGISRYEKKKNDEDSESNIERVWVIKQLLMTDETLVYHFDGDTGKLIDKITRPPKT